MSRACPIGADVCPFGKCAASKAINKERKIKMKLTRRGQQSGALAPFRQREWSPFSELNRLRQEINRVFEEPFGGFVPATGFFEGWNPSIDIYEDKDNLVVKAELPGMKREDIQVSLHDGSLSISGERKTETKHEDAEVYRSERFVGRSNAR